MAAKKLLRQRGRFGVICLVGVGALAYAGYYRESQKPKPEPKQDSHAYWVDHIAPAGWDTNKESVLLFYYTKPKSTATMKAFVTHGLPGIHEGSPEEADKMARSMVGGLTSYKRYGTAELAGTFEAGERFTLVKRNFRERTTLTAFASRGVTMLAVELSQRDAEGDVLQYREDLERVLQTVRFIQQPLPDTTGGEIQAITGPPPSSLLDRG